MKAIKTYESFFRRKKSKKEWFKNANIINEIKETFLDLTDYGFVVYVYKYEANSWSSAPAYKIAPKYDIVSIKIHKNIKEHRVIAFTLNEIKDTLESSISYLKDVFNLEIDKILYVKYEICEKVWRGEQDTNYLLKNTEIVNSFNKINYDQKIPYIEIFLK